MRGSILILLAIMLVLPVIATDNGYLSSTGHKIGFPERNGSNLAWQIHTPPTPLLETFDDQAISANNGNMIFLHESSYGDSDLKVLSVQARDDYGAEPRAHELYFYHPENDNIGSYYTSAESNQTNVVSAMDFETHDLIFVWEQWNDESDICEICISCDVWHLVNCPGLISSSHVVFSNNSNEQEFPCGLDNSFRNPQVHIGKAPSYAEDGKRRLYIFLSRPYMASRFQDVKGQFKILWCDFDTQDIEDGSMLEPDWNIVEFDVPTPPHPATSDPVSTYLSCDCRDDGLFGIYCWIDGSYESMPLGEENIFVLINENYCEGEWQTYSRFLGYEVESPLNHNRMPWLQGIDELYIAPVHAGNFNALWDDFGHFHIQMPFCLQGVQFRVPTRWPLMSQVRNVTYNHNSHQIFSVDVYPVSENPIEGDPVLPWDIDEDGIVDVMDYETGEVVPACCYPWPHWNEEYADTHNGIRLVCNQDEGWMACFWSDALKSWMYNNGYDLPEEANRPEIFFTTSGYWVVEWRQAQVLSGNPEDDDFVPEMEGKIPRDLILANTIPEFTNWSDGLLSIAYYNDNEYGFDDDSGGTIEYMSIQADCERPIETRNADVTPPQASISCFPNPFNPATTIRYNLPEDSPVNISIFNVKGQIVRRLVDEHQTAGNRSMEWNGKDDYQKNVSSGVYMIRMRTNGIEKTQKVMLLK